jgi:hypothetical protein
MGFYDGENDVKPNQDEAEKCYRKCSIYDTK